MSLDKQTLSYPCQRARPPVESVEVGYTFEHHQEEMAIQGTFQQLRPTLSIYPKYMYLGQYILLTAFVLNFEWVCFTRPGPGLFNRGFEMIVRVFDMTELLYIHNVFGQTGLSKQCKPRSDAAECGVWSGSTMFVTHPAILYTFIGSRMELLKF